jgi:branched-chain amino acid transport system substrate-binding protein
MRSNARRLGILSACLVLAACGGQSNPPASGSKAPYQLTISTDLSGPFSASSGIPQTEGFLAYVANTNAAGGVNGHKVRMEVLDDRSDVQTGLANYQNALSSSTLAMLMEQASAIAGPVAAKAINDHLVVSNNTEYMGGGVFPYIYDVYPSADLYAKTLGDFAATLAKSVTTPKVALLLFDTPAQRSGFGPRFEKVLKDKNWNVVYKEFVPIATVDFSVAAGTIGSAKPDVIATNLLDSQLPAFVSALRSRGVMTPVVNTVAIITDATLKKINDQNVYLLQFTISPSDTANPSVVAVRKAGAESGHIRGLENGLFMLGYVHAQVILAALAKCGDNCTREGLNGALEQTDVDSNGLMAGRPGYSKTDHTMPKKLAVVRFDSGKGFPTAVTGFGFDK